MPALNTFDPGDAVKVHQTNNRASITGTLLLVAGDVALVTNEATGLDPRPVAVPAANDAVAA
jgi:hypothetical protein